MVKEIEIIKLEARSRDERGSNAVNRLRREGWLPAVVYDSQGQSRPVQFNRHAFELMVRRHGGQNLIIDMEVDGAVPVKVLLKDVQRDSISDHMLHVDLQEVSMTRKLRLDVTIHLIGEPVGVSKNGGLLEHLLRTVEIECLPTDIVQELELDVGALDVGDSLFVRDLPVSESITVLTPGNIAVASVHMPAVEEEAKPEAAAEGTEEEGAEAKSEVADKAESPEKSGKEKEKEKK